MKAVFLVSLFVLFLGAILFGSAGRLDWPMAWAFLSAFLAFSVVAFLVLDRELIRERASMQSGVKGKDLALASLAFVFLYPLTVAVAGLDAVRFGWSPPLPTVAQASALAVFAFGYGFAFWAMMSNQFFSTFVRIQAERGHELVTDGPYAYVRHPGYSGTILAHLALPLALGSLWGLIPAFCGASLFVLRTLLEDRTLEQELAGYRAYKSQVPWRLIPGLW